MHPRVAVGIDEVGFNLIHLLLGLDQHRHKPDAAKFEALRRTGSPLVPPGREAPPVPEVTLEQVREPQGLAPDMRLRFASPLPCAWPENNTVHVDLYCPGRGWGSGIVLGCPGVLTGAKNLSERPFRMWARAVSRRGLTFGLVHPPYHMRRTPANMLSGELMFSGDLFTAAQGYVQIVADLKAAVSWALTLTPQVGYWGASMGGIIGLMLAAREPRLRCAIPMIPAADASAPIFESTLCQLMREDWVGAGGTAADLHTLMLPLDPFHNPPAIARDRVLLVEAMHDQVCYAADLERLWAAWDFPPILRYPHGHLSIFSSRAVFRDMLAFLQAFLSGPRIEAAERRALPAAA